MTKDIKSFLPYYIGTGAEVEYEIDGRKVERELHHFQVDYISKHPYITSIRFTNLISIDELTDEQKVKLFNFMYAPDLVKFTDKQKATSIVRKLQSIDEYSPELFHQLLQMRVDLFNLKEK